MMKIVAYLVMVVSLSAHAEVSTDGSLGAVKTFSGHSQIPQSLGTTVGNNLFHSFQQFNLQKGESATFTGDAALKNVISRVTGGNLSTINGLLKSEIGKANFYFINPAGVTFGANAQVDVPAAFHISTADKLTFSDGKEFNTQDMNASSLSIAEPVYFGFLTNQAGNIKVENTQLNFVAQNDVLFNANNMSFENSAVNNMGGEVNLQALNTISLNNSAVSLNAITTKPVGNLNVNAAKLSIVNGSGIYSTVNYIGDGADIHVTATDSLLLDGQNATNFTGIDSIANLNSSGKNGGIYVNTGQLDILNAGMISSDNYGAGNSNPIVVNADNIFISNLINPGWTGIYGTAWNSGRGADVNVNAANHIEFLGGDSPLYMVTGTAVSNSEIHGDTYGSGDSGSVVVTAKSVNITDSGIIGTTSRGSGNSGDVTVQTQNLTVSGSRSDISSESHDPVLENVHHNGNVNITTGQLNVLNGGIISTASFTTGQGGDLIINADTIRMENNNFSLNDLFYSVLCSIAHAGSLGQAGRIKINTNDLLISDKCNICSQTLSSAQGGSIEIKASNLILDGQLSSIGSGSLSSGNAGHITIDTNTLILNKGATIGNSNFSSGDAGNISINAHKLSIDNAGNLTPIPTGIGADVGTKYWYDTYINTSFAPIILGAGAATGKGGDITIRTDILDIKNGAQISSNVQSFKESGGQVGNISITANDWVHLSEQSAITIQNDAILANSQLAKNIVPGTISITSPEIDLKDSSITAAATTEVDAGKININFSKQLNQTNTSFITTSANTGNGGDISINGNGVINLQNSGFLTSVAKANGHGGDVNVTANILIMNNGVIQANAVGGSGGDIGLNLKALIPSYNSLIEGGTKVTWQPFIAGFNVIQAASDNGVSGTLNITAPQFDISGSISGLDSSGLALPHIEGDACSGTIEKTSSLAPASKGGLPLHEATNAFIPPITQVRANINSEAVTENQTVTVDLIPKKDNSSCTAF